MRIRSWAHVLAVGILAGTLILLVTTESTATAKKKRLPTFSMANYGQLSNSPTAFKGAHVDVSGKVFTIPPTDTKGTSAVQMWMDPQNSDWNTLVVYRTTSLKPQIGDYLHIVGTARGSYRYKGGFGQADTATLIGASSVTETDEAATEPPISSTGTALSTCAIDSYDSTLVDITGSIVNPSATPYNYDITVEILSGGARVGTAEEFEDSVTPQQPTTWSTSGDITGGNGTVSCQILSVQRTTP